MKYKLVLFEEGRHFTEDFEEAVVGSIDITSEELNRAEEDPSYAHLIIRDINAATVKKSL